jgi:chemotaxis protein histidine kinase CheA
MRQTVLFRGALALALLSFTLMVCAQQKPARRATSVRSSTMDSRNNHQYLNIDEDSSANPPLTYITYKSDSFYNIVLSGGKPAVIYVNGRQVPADSFYVYDGLIKRMKAQMERDKEQAVRDREQAVRDKIQAEKDVEQAVRDKQQAERDAEQAVRDKVQAEKEVVREKAQAERDAQQAVQDKQQAERDVQQAVRDKAQAERDAQQAVKDRAQADRDKEQAVRDKEQAERDKEQAVRDKIQAEEDKALVKALMAEVVKEGLAPDEKSVTSLILDESLFFLNGKKQSDELQKKFKGKFIKKPGYSIHFHNGMTNVGRMDD